MATGPTAPGTEDARPVIFSPPPSQRDALGDLARPSTDTTSARSSTVVDPNELAHERDRDAPTNDFEKPPDPFEVTMGPDDPDDPKTWSRSYRWYITMLSSMLLLNATFASSSPSGVLPDLMQQFKFSEEVGTLTISIFVLGYCVGPLLWGPLSEYIGRKPVFLVSFLFYTGFQVGSALAPNTASVLVFRFLGGTFAAAPLANSGAVISDIWDADTRGKALAWFTLAPFAGPSLGPIVSGWIQTSGASWRWVFWVLTIFAGVCFVAVLFTLPETYAPVILVRRAKKLRKETEDDRYWAPLEHNQMPLHRQIAQILGRPFAMMIREPMLMAIVLYMSFIYGCIYLLFEAFPIVFGPGGYNFSDGFTGMTFLSIFVGACSGVVVYLVYFNPRYERLMAAFEPFPVPPEHRLEVCMWPAPVFAAAFFWFGWTSFPSVSFWAPLAAGVPLGFAIILIFLGLFNYTIDAYLVYAASALSAATVVRSLFGAGFPLFAAQMYRKLSPQWASTLLGFIAVALAPIPFVLRFYGHHLRKRSRYTPDGDMPPIKPPSKQVKEGAQAA